MRRIHSFILGLLCGAIFFGGTAVLANSDVLARITSQIFFWNQNQIELEAYNINGYNYIRLRDAARVFNVNIEYYENTDSVYMDKPTEPAIKSEIVIDGNAYAREDFSKSANQDIFNDVYTKEAYNALRQSIADKEIITAGTDKNGYNPNYSYAHYIDSEFTLNTPGRTDAAMKSVAAALSGYYVYEYGYEPGIKNLYEYPGYRILKPQINSYLEPANTATDSFVSGLSNLSDREKVKRIASYICDRITYNSENTKNINEIFTASQAVNGICGVYADCFIYLCQRAEIACVSVTDASHAWNEAYVDGKWETVDISYYDIARTDEALFAGNYPRRDTNPAKTKFAKELLVPSSTK